MALKIPGLKVFSAANAKSRVLIVALVLVGLGLGIYFLLHYIDSGTSGGGGTRVAGAPTDLQTVPGSEVSPEFYNAVVQANTQAAQQAQLTGGSAVPILVNTPQQAGSFPQQQNCTIVCPSEDDVNVNDDINALLKQNKLTAVEGKRLLDLAKNNVPVEEYADALNELVRQGKLTPEQARILLDKYRKQHERAALVESGQTMDAMIKAGQLPLDVASHLLSLQKSGLAPNEYAAELNRLVREGKISPEAAARLLAQYTQQKMRAQAQEGAFALQQMAKAGEITPDVAKSLTALQGQNVPVDQYAAELDRLVAAGKLTPAAAAKLLEQYRKQRNSNGVMGTLSALVGQEEGKAVDAINEMVKSGKLSQADADTLLSIQRQATRPEDCQNNITKLIQQKKLSVDPQVLIANCKKVAAARAQAQRLATLQGNNASIEDFTNELKEAVKSGVLTPTQAATLLAQYKAVVVASSGGRPVAGLSVDTSIPGTEGFAKLQQQVQAAEASNVPEAPPAEEEFAVTSTENQGELEAAQAQARLERIAQMQAAMTGQAQSLIAVWQAPPVIVSKEGTPPTDKLKENLEAIANGKEGSSTETTVTTKTSTRALIKAGTILFAVLDTAVDSDYPDTPVMATIVQGDLKGAKLLGKLNLVQGKDKVSLNFTLMDKEGWPSSKSISAFAIDPDTARTVMASNVDYHYFKRYGAMMATSFLTGYANAIQQAGTSTPGILGPSTTHPELSPGNKIAVGLGQIGTTMGSAMANYINTPTTVKVNSGVGLGILFMGELKE